MLTLMKDTKKTPIIDFLALLSSVIGALLGWSMLEVLLKWLN